MWPFRKKPRVRPDPPEPLPDASWGYRLVRIARSNEQHERGYWREVTHPFDTWQIERYVPPFYYEGGGHFPTWQGNYWHKVCVVRGKSKALSVMRVLKNPPEIVYE